MQRVTRSTAVAVQPAAPASPGPPGFFTGGNPGGGVAATVPGYEWFNMVQEELVGLVLRGGVTLSAADQTQVRQALDRLYGGGYRYLTANTTLTADDAGLIFVDASGGSRTVTLPAANAAAGRPMRLQFVRVDSSANAATIQRAGSDTIEGVPSVALQVEGRLNITSDGGAGWWILVGALAQAVPVGVVAHFPATAAPSGWLKANGALVARASFPRLWAFAQASGNLVSDASWTGLDYRGAFSQGDGATNFRLPDLRGEFVRGWDDGRGLDAGRVIGSPQASQNLAHEHNLMTEAGGGFGNLVFKDLPSAGSPWTEVATANMNEFAAAGFPVRTYPSGGTEARPRNVALLACIKF